MDQPLTLIHLLVARHVVNRLIFTRNSKPCSMMTIIQPKLFDAILWYLLRWYCSSMADITMSLDGFIGGLNYDIERFHDWLFYCKTEPPGWQILFSPVFGYQCLFFLPLLLRVWTAIWLRHIRANIPRYWYYNKGKNKSGPATHTQILITVSYELDHTAKWCQGGYFSYYWLYFWYRSLSLFLEQDSLINAERADINEVLDRTWEFTAIVVCV